MSDVAHHRRLPWSRWLTLALTLCSAALAAPFLAGHYLPFLDLPQHVGAVAVLANADAAFRFAHYYSVDLATSPYLLPYLVAAGLAQFVGPVAAVHLLFALAACTLPWASAWAAWRFERDPWIGLLAAPFAFGAFAFMGFLNFVLSFPVFLLWLGWWRGAVGRPRFGPGSYVLGGALSIGLFYGHVMTFGFAMGACGLVALLAETPDEGHRPWPALAGRLLRGLHFLPGVALFGAWTALSDTAKKGELGRMVSHTIAAEPPRWDHPLDRLKGLLDYALSVYQDQSDEWLLYGWIFAFALFVILRKSDVRDRVPPAPLEAPSEPLRSPSEPLGSLPARAARARSRAELLPPLLVLSALILALLLPATYRGIWPIATRMAPLLALLALLLPRGPVLWQPAALAIGLTLAGATGWVHASHIAAFQPEVGPLDEVVQKVPKGARVMTLIWERDSAVVRWPTFLHFSQYVLAARGGVSEFSFVNFTKSPIHYVEAHAPPRLPARFEWTPHAYNHGRDGGWYDRVLMRDGGRSRASQVFRHGPKMQLLKRAGPWALFGKVAAPPRPASAAPASAAPASPPQRPGTPPAHR